MSSVKCYAVNGRGRFFIVVGSSGDHITTGHFCTCADFNFRKKECVHMKVLREAIELKLYDTVSVEPEELSQVFKYAVREIIFEQPR